MKRVCFNPHRHAWIFSTVFPFANQLQKSHWRDLNFNVKSNWRHCLWGLDVQCHIQKCSPVILILSRINLVLRIDIYFFKPPRDLFPVGLPVKILSLLHSPFSSLLGPNIHPRTLVWNILSLHFSFNVLRSHIGSTTGNISFFYIFYFSNSQRSLEEKGIWIEL